MKTKRPKKSLIELILNMIGKFEHLIFRIGMLASSSLTIYYFLKSHFNISPPN